MTDKAEQIVGQLLLGDILVSTLRDIDDLALARHLHDCIWDGIDPAQRSDAAAARDRPAARPTHDVATTPVHELDREAVIDRLIDAGTLQPPNGRTYDVDHDAAADAYRLGRYDALGHLTTNE